VYLRLQKIGDHSLEEKLFDLLKLTGLLCSFGDPRWRGAQEEDRRTEVAALKVLERESGKRVELFSGNEVE